MWIYRYIANSNCALTLYICTSELQCLTRGQRYGAFPKGWYSKDDFEARAGIRGRRSSIRDAFSKREPGGKGDRECGYSPKLCMIPTVVSIECRVSVLACSAVVSGSTIFQSASRSIDRATLLNKGLTRV